MACFCELLSIHGDPLIAGAIIMDEIVGVRSMLAMKKTNQICCNDNSPERVKSGRITGQSQPIALSENSELASPFEILSRAYLRRRSCADDLLLVADGEAKYIERVVSFLEEKYPEILRIESDVLIPMLNRYCSPEDNIAALSRKLTGAGHEKKISIESIVSLLKGLSKSGAPEKSAADTIREFAWGMRKRSALWTSVVLPIARVRFDRAAENELASMINDCIEAGEKEKSK